jgi:TPR repeat protein
LHLADATIAHRRPIHLEWVAAAPAAPAAPATPATAAAPATSPAAAATAPAAPNSAVAAAGPPQEAAAPVRAATPARQLDREEIDVLVKRGKDFLMSGDVAAARLVLQRAAESNDADAALTLAATYDPGMLRELKVYGVAADIALARAWYEKAAALGSTEAPHRLAVLASTTH